MSPVRLAGRGDHNCIDCKQGAEIMAKHDPAAAKEYSAGLRAVRRKALGLKPEKPTPNQEPIPGRVPDKPTPPPSIPARTKLNEKSENQRLIEEIDEIQKKINESEQKPEKLIVLERSHNTVRKTHKERQREYRLSLPKDPSVDGLMETIERYAKEDFRPLGLQVMFILTEYVRQREQK